MKKLFLKLSAIGYLIGYDKIYVCYQDLKL